MTRAWVVISLSFAAAACGTDRPAGTSPPIDSLIGCTGLIGVTPAAATLHTGDTLRLHAFGSANCAPGSTEWRWRSSDTLVMSVDSTAGLVRARSQGTATAIAEAVVDRNVKAAAAITVAP